MFTGFNGQKKYHSQWAVDMLYFNKKKKKKKSLYIQLPQRVVGYLV